MKQFLKQSTESATASMRNPFAIARVKLTAYYLACTVVVLAIFSILLISTLEKNLKNSYEEFVESDVQKRNEVFIRTSDGIQTSILLVDGLILILVGGIAYFLAGKTLVPIKEATDRQKRFTADASHDLRTPLTILRTTIEVALQNRAEDPEVYKKVLHSGLEEVKTMSLLVEDLLVLARNEAGENKREKKQIHLEECIQGIVERISIEAKQKSIAIHMHMEKTSPVFANETYLMRAFQNIIQNAVQYTPPYGTITVSVEKVGAHVVCRVKDTGPGIAKGDLPHIFERFYKSSHSRSEAGSGLGLAIAKEIIESNMGTIEIESTIGSGTEVTVKVPV